MPTGDEPEPSDDAFEQLLRDVLQNDPVPEAVLARARAAGRMRAPADSELLDLVYDSLTDCALPGVDTDERARLLVFSGATVCLVVRLESTSGGTRLSGWTAPTRVEGAQVGTENGTSDLTVDQNGTIITDHVVIGNSRIFLWLDIRDERHVFHTSWFLP